MDTQGEWQLWADAGGQWSYLSSLAPALLQTSAGASVTLPVRQTDVWLGPNDTLRVYVQGYRANCVDGYFGKLFAMSSYNAGLSFWSTAALSITMTWVARCSNCRRRSPAPDPASGADAGRPQGRASPKRLPLCSELPEDDAQR
jgi:hypothetical protein